MTALPLSQPAQQQRRFTLQTDSIGRTGDIVIFGTLLATCGATLAIGSFFNEFAMAALGAAALALLGIATFTLGRGGLISRLLLSLGLAATIALQIQIGRGTLELHFGVFVTLALLLVYRDWRPILAVAAFFAVHHVAFDRLQAAGFGFYCTPNANFLRTSLHAVYVVVQTSLEIYLTITIGRLSKQGDELEALVRAVEFDGRISLDVDHVAVATAGGSALKNVLSRMAEVLTQVRSSTDSIGRASAEIASGNADLNTRTEQTATNLQHAASTMAALTGNVAHSAASSRNADQLANSAATVAQRGGAVVAEVVAVMDEINRSSKKISDIIGVIDGIAFQTNILALNAAVEAARAGEQGRGFAVVASEVRSLAGRSAAAAREIKTLIVSSVEKVDAGSKLVADAGATMTEIVGSVQRVSDIIGEITTAAADQSGGIGQVNAAVGVLDQMTQQNAAMVEQSAAAAESLREQTKRLAQVVDTFQLAGAAAAR